MSLALVVFWSSLALVVYTYLGFPALLWLRSRLRPRPHGRGDIEPSVSFVICAHNEAPVLAAKLENVLGLDYPRDRLQIIVASDGSDDGTAEIARRYEDAGVQLLDLPRRGKIPALNDAVEQARGEILVFSDANSMFERGALRALVGPFADPGVGGVAGDQRYGDDPASEADGERLYWNLDRQLKQWQSRAGSVTSSTGAIHAIRRAHFEAVPSAVTDDFFVSTSVLRQGGRLVFEPRAVSVEPPAASSGLEFRRKVRVITRGLRGVTLRRELLNPFRHGFYSLQLFSHKVLRRLVALPILAAVLATPWLAAEGFVYQLALLGEGVVILSALLGLLQTRAGERAALPLRVPLFFCMVNAAALTAAWNVARGHRIDRWDPRRS